MKFLPIGMWIVTQERLDLVVDTSREYERRHSTIIAVDKITTTKWLTERKQLQKQVDELTAKLYEIEYTAMFKDAVDKLVKEYAEMPRFNDSEPCVICRRVSSIRKYARLCFHNTGTKCPDSILLSSKYTLPDMPILMCTCQSCGYTYNRKGGQ